MGKKVISFSLWGDSKLYCQGAVDNVAEAKEHYPDWVCRFYVAKNCPAIPALAETGSEVILMDENLLSIDRNNETRIWHWQTDHAAMMWRFMAMSDVDVDYVIFRDTDSRVNSREAAAVQEWIDSGLWSHRMHENAGHWNAPVMGGMWGVRGGLFPDIVPLIARFISKYQVYSQPWIFSDLIFIREVLWSRLQFSCMGHGFGHPKPFPKHSPMKYGSYVGEVVHEEWRNEKYQPCNSLSE